MSHRSQLDELAGQLYEREVLFRDDLERIYGPREADVIAAQLKEKEAANAPELAEKTESQDVETPTTEPDNADVSSQSDAAPDATT